MGINSRKKKDVSEQLQLVVTALGLSEKTAKVYAFLLTCGGAYPSRIADTLKLNRTTVYKLLVEMSVQGIVEEIEKNKKYYYEATSIRNLERLVTKRINNQKDALREMKTLEEQIQGSPKETHISRYTGASGVQEALRDILVSSRKELLSFSNPYHYRAILPVSVYKQYAEKKKTLGIETRAIVLKDQRTEDFRNKVYLTVGQRKALTVKYLPPGTRLFDGDISIYGEDKVSFTLFNNEEVETVIVQNRALYIMLKQIFEAYWKLL